MAVQRHAVTLLVVGLCAWWASQTHTYARVWVSDVTLWHRAVRMAPMKPRPILNWGVMLVAQGRFAAAERVFATALRAAALPHVHPWDRALTETDVARNRQSLQTLRTLTGR